MYKRRFRNNVTVITGASSGIGRSLALGLAEAGAPLVLAARSNERLTEVATECEARGGRALVVPTDVTEPVHCQNLAERAVEHYGRIDTLVNNAGIAMIARFDEVRELSLYERIMRVNYLGSVYCTHSCLPYLKQSGGHIVVIASVAGRTGVPLYSAYSASKHAMIGFFESIRIELKPAGVGVTLILPDFISSGIHERGVNGEGGNVGMAHNVDYQRAMSPEKCARLCIRAMARRRREVYLSWRGRIGQWIKVAAPDTIDALSKKVIDRGY